MANWFVRKRRKIDTVREERSKLKCSAAQAIESRSRDVSFHTFGAIKNDYTKCENHQCVQQDILRDNPRVYAASLLLLLVQFVLVVEHPQSFSTGEKRKVLIPAVYIFFSRCYATTRKVLIFMFPLRRTRRSILSTHRRRSHPAMRRKSFSGVSWESCHSPTMTIETKVHSSTA